MRFVMVVAGLMLVGCAGVVAPTPTAVPTTVPTATGVPVTATPEVKVGPPNVGAFESGEYRNLFKEMLGKSDAEIQAKLDEAWQQLFYGDDDYERVYFPVGDDMAYMMDIGNDDVRSEGMSYGMMLAVQLDKQEEFNRLWKWTKTHMYQTEGQYKGVLCLAHGQGRQQAGEQPRVGWRRVVRDGAIVRGKQMGKR